jgi:sialic acid synthase SpsE
METLRREFGIPVGLSDHTTGIVSSISAAALGACCVEKHITLSRAMPGTDHAAALEAEGLRRLVKYIREVELAMGSGEISMPAAVQSARNKLGRSLVSRVDIPAGTRLQESMLMLKSPGTGLRWSQRDQLLGRISRLDIASDVVLDDSQFEP